MTNYAGEHIKTWKDQYMLENKVALVTGGNRGIGEAICLELANAGAIVYLTYKEKGIADDSELLFNPDIRAYQMDVTDRLRVYNVSSAIGEAHGFIDVLVNNAGINVPTDFDKIKDEEWDMILDVNLKGPFILMQEAISLLKDGGSIINIASISGQYGGPRTAHYAASKAGLISLSQVVARFVAHRNIRVNCISPGLIESPMTEQSGMTTEGILLGRFGLPEEVAKAVLWLASDDTKYITGQTININGGLYW
jgi:3-oxoacyl-[acyl-carrier protein] reductase